MRVARTPFARASEPRHALSSAPAARETTATQLELPRSRRHLDASGRKPGKERFRYPELGRLIPRSFRREAIRLAQLEDKPQRNCGQHCSVHEPPAGVVAQAATVRDFCSGAAGDQSSSQNLVAGPATMQKPTRPGHSKLSVLGSTGSKKAIGRVFVGLYLGTYVGRRLRPRSNFPRVPRLSPRTRRCPCGNRGR